MLCTLSQSTYGNTYELNQRKKVQEIYTKEIGVTEATGNNDGPRIKEYLATCNLPEGTYWCAAFVTWVFIQADIPAIKSGWSPNWFKPQYVIYTRNGTNNKVPQTGDVGGIYFKEKKRIAHVFFIDDWKPMEAFVITVEGNAGNTSSNNGTMVCKKRRVKSQIKTVSDYISQLRI